PDPLFKPDLEIFVLRTDGVEQAGFQCVRRFEHPGLSQQHQSFRRAGQAHEVMTASPGWRDLQLAMNEADSCVRRCEPQIASQGEFGASAKGYAIDARNDRDGKVSNRVESSL